MCASPSPLAGRGRRALARRVRGILHRHGLAAPPHPDPLPASGERERASASGLRGDPIALPAMNSLYALLAPIVEALLRMAVGLALVPHGLRNTFGFFPKTIPVHSIPELAAQLDRDGYRPGK